MIIVASKIHTVKLEREKSNIIHKVLGGLLILASLFLLAPYFRDFFQIIIAIVFLSTGLYFLTKETRFRWFRIRRF